MNEETLLSGENALYLEQLYESYREDPSSVDEKWHPFFQNMNGDGSAAPLRTRAPRRDDINGFFNETEAAPKKETKSTSTPDRRSNDHRAAGREIASFSLMGVDNLLNTYRRVGHLAAKLDPLGLAKPVRSMITKLLANFNQEDLNTVVPSPFKHQGRTKLQEVIDHLESVYCSSIGMEHYYLVTEDERTWIQSTLENEISIQPLTTFEKLHIYEKLFQADYFEKFLAKKYVGKKRFSLEGGEALIPLMDTAIEQAGKQGIENVAIGMAHRGRLNVLVNIMEKPAAQIFAEFDENYDPETLDYADVKYHLGYSSDKMTFSGNEVHLSLGFNPSHLEAVDPVIVGKARAEQDYKQDTDRTKVMPILIHGDAAFAGQGVVAETLNLMNLEGYNVGGTVHIVINNQIGFTTLPQESRSTLYATDLAKGFQVPIFHVNGDDPEAVYKTTVLAMKYREKFKKDVIIDLICYRRLGHNENDEPAFTQPEMYAAIKKHPSALKQYEQKLSQDKDISAKDIEFIREGEKKGLDYSFDLAKQMDAKMKVDTLKGHWTGFRMKSDKEPETRLLSDKLAEVAEAITTVPKTFTPHKKLVRFLDNRAKMYTGNQPIDWGFAEALAFGSILQTGRNVRLAGQDAQRGTFTHRHCVMNDSNTGEKYIPLNYINEQQGRFEVINSPLSEFAALGFEYGYSLSEPNTLVIWEAQFGDFANNAQVIFDQFISSSEAKWYRMSGLVVLLPHGYEGQGPEHSSARLERFLQMCSKDNMVVCNCSTPSQYFHLLRRQILRDFRKPLIVMTPKSLLRLPAAGSKLSDLEKGSFLRVAYDSTAEKAPEKVTRWLICSGKIYYDLKTRRDEIDGDHIAIARVEQLYPFPSDDLKEELKKYPNIKEIFFVQEEPQNQGPWMHVLARHKRFVPDGMPFDYIGRDQSPSPACGFHKLHLIEQEEIVSTAVGPPPAKKK